MARPSPSSPPGKRKIPVLDIFVVVIGVLAIMGYNRMTIARLARSIPNVNSQVVGEWKSTRGPEHLVFRADNSVSLTTPAKPPAEGGTAEAAQETSGPAPVPGKYQLAQSGKIYVQLMNGQKYTTTISPQNPDRFDLIDAQTDGVTTYERVKQPQP
jgi:cell division septation protein DedD